MYYREMSKEDIPIVTKMYVETFRPGVLVPAKNVWEAKTPGHELFKMLL